MSQTFLKAKSYFVRLFEISDIIKYKHELEEAIKTLLSLSMIENVVSEMVFIERVSHN